MKSSQRGAVDGGLLFIVIGGLMIVGLLAHSYTTGQELPLWPAVAVILVNLLGIWKILGDRRSRRPPQGGDLDRERKGS